MSRSKAFLMGLTKNSTPKEKDKRFSEMVSFVFNWQPVLTPAPLAVRIQQAFTGTEMQRHMADKY